MNELETAVLREFAESIPELLPLAQPVKAISRRLTGKGSYTEFELSSPLSMPLNQYIFDQLIELPEAPYGMGATLICEDGTPVCLELFTHAGKWDGSFSKFSFGVI